MKNKKWILIKTVIFAVIIVIVNIVVNAFSPTFSASVAVQQAYDTYESSASLTIYNQVKHYGNFVWMLVGLLVYRKEIRSFFNKIK